MSDTDSVDATITNPFARHIGERIQYFRRMRGLSLSELSRRSDIAKGTLSRLETGRGNPTVMTLAALAGILDVTPSDFLPLGPGEASVETQALSGPGISMRFIHRSVLDSVWEVYETVVPPRSEPIVSRTHGGTEHLLMLAGEASVGPSDAPVHLRPGEHLAFPGDVPHLYWAKDRPARLYLMMEYPLSDAVENDALRQEAGATRMRRDL